MIASIEASLSRSNMGSVASRPGYDRSRLPVSHLLSPEYMAPGSGFEQLPPEVLLHIILLTSTPIKMSTVCQTLRSLCLAHAQLWTTILLDTCRSMERLPLHLERSGSLPLTLLVSVTNGTSDYCIRAVNHNILAQCTATHAFPSAALPHLGTSIYHHMDRVQNMSLKFQSCSDTTISRTFACFNVTAPQLQTVTIYGLDSNNISFPPGFLENSWADLRKLRFNGSVSLVQTLHHRLSSQNLTRLTLELDPFQSTNQPPINISQFLRDHATTLVELGLSMTSATLSTEHHFPSTSDSIEIPHLKRLVLDSIVAPLSLIRAPSLEIFSFISPILSGDSYHPSLGAFASTPLFVAQNFLVDFLRYHAGCLLEIFIHVRCDQDESPPNAPAPIIEMPVLAALTIETWHTFQNQLVVISAPVLVTFHYIPHGHVPSRDIFSFTNTYYTKLGVLNITSPSYTTPGIPFAATAPVQYPQLRHVTVRTFGQSLYHSLIQECRYVGKGAVSAFLDIGPHFTWNIFSDGGHDRLTLDGVFEGELHN